MTSGKKRWTAWDLAWLVPALATGGLGVAVRFVTDPILRSSLMYLALTFAFVGMSAAAASVRMRGGDARLAYAMAVGFCVLLIQRASVNIGAVETLVLVAMVVVVGAYGYRSIRQTANAQAPGGT